MADDTILHQDAVEAVVLSVAAKKGTATIGDVASPGVGYVQAEAVAVRNAVNSILAALRTAGVIV
jgi:hypothetical protein